MVWQGGTPAVATAVDVDDGGGGGRCEEMVEDIMSVCDCRAKAKCRQQQRRTEATKEFQTNRQKEILDPASVWGQIE